MIKQNSISKEIKRSPWHKQAREHERTEKCVLNDRVYLYFYCSGVKWRKPLYASNREVCFQ